MEHFLPVVADLPLVQEPGIDVHLEASELIMSGQRLAYEHVDQQDKVNADLHRVGHHESEPMVIMKDKGILLYIRIPQLPRNVVGLQEQDKDHEVVPGQPQRVVL